MFARPGISELRDQVISDVMTAMGLPTLLRRSALRSLALAQAGLAYQHFGYLDWIARQSTPFTATGVFLEAWAALVSVYRKPATQATGTAYFTGTVGVVVPGGTPLVRADGARYATVADVTLAGNGTGTVGIQAVMGGSAATLTDGTPLSLSSTVAGVQSAASADHGAAGADPELDAPFRTRMLLQYANPPQGGAASDYVEWAVAVAGVTRAWAKSNGMGAGSVVVYFMMDQAEASSAGFPQGTNGVSQHEARAAPATGDQLLLADAIYPLRPATALIYACAPIAYPVPFVLRPKSPVPAAVTALVNTAIARTFNTLGSPLGETLEISPFETAIAAVPGMPDFTILSPALPIQAPLGSLPIWAGVSYA